MKLDKIAELELSYFLNLSDNEYNKNNRKSDVKKEPFLKNPLRVVWLIKLIYDTGKDVRKMNLLDYESEILRKTVKDRFESRIWPRILRIRESSPKRVPKHCILISNLRLPMEWCEFHF